MLTANGYIKKISLNFFSSIRSTGIIAIQLVCPSSLLIFFLFPTRVLICITILSRVSLVNLQVPGDELKWVRLCTNDDRVAMASQNGMVILTSCEIVCFCFLYFFFVFFLFYWLIWNGINHKLSRFASSPLFVPMRYPNRTVCTLDGNHPYLKVHFPYSRPLFFMYFLWK